MAAVLNIDFKALGRGRSRRLAVQLTPRQEAGEAVGTRGWPSAGEEYSGSGHILKVELIGVP